MQTAEATSPKGAARKISSISTARCGHRTLRRGSIKAYFVGVDDHIDPRLQGTNQGLGYTLTWQNGRQLASMRFGTVNIGFTYDVDGLRTSKNVHNVDLEHKYYYVGNRLQYETIGDSSALWYFYDADGNPSGIRYKDHNGTVNDYYFVCNWRGDVIQIYNAAGELVSTYDYDAWGRVSENSTDKDTQNIAEINPIRYRGYYYDSETGLYYLKSRYYDPAVKRFINGDTVVATNNNKFNNVYSYCFNNPIRYDDQTGCYTGWDDAAAALVGGGVSVLTKAAVDLASGSFESTESYIGAFVGGALGGWMSLYYPGFSGAISGGVSSLVTNLLEMQFSNSQKKMDEVMVEALLEATKGMLLDVAFDYLPISTYKCASSESQRYLNKIATSGSFRNRRDAFYKYAESVFSSSIHTNLPEGVTKFFGFLLYTINQTVGGG